MDIKQQTKEQQSDAAFAELLGKAEPRVVPPADDERIVREAVQAEWQQLTGRRVRNRRIVSLAVAASVVLAAFTGLNVLRDGMPAFETRTLASVERHFGDITIRDANGVTNTLSAAIEGSDRLVIEGGDVVATGQQAGLALAWHSGGSLRLDAGTIITFDAPNQVYLQAGRVYFDSVANPVDAAARSAGPTDFSVRTDRGVVRHFGTQYMTEIDGDELVVTVREGIVSVDGGGANVRASAGKRVRVATTGGQEFSDVDTYGEQWAWIERTSPAVNLGGRRVSEALQWVSRETGREIVFATADAEQLAVDTALVGLQDDLQMPPSRALELFMLTVDLDARIDAGSIIVSKARP